MHAKGSAEKDENNRVTRMFGTAQNITNRKRVEEALRESEEKYRSLVDSTNDWVWACDIEGRQTFANKAVKTILGYDVHEIEGVLYENLIHPEDQRKTRQWFKSLIEKKKGWKNSVIRCRHKDGTIKVLESTAQPIFDPEGNLTGFIGIDRDVTNRKKLEAQLQQSQKMESIGTLAGGIAHDFNNILFPIIGYAEMMLDDLPADSPHRNNTSEILQGAKRASDLVKQILTFSRQSGQELKPLKVQFVIKEVLKLIRSSIPTTIEIKQHISNKCGLVTADPTQIHQVAMNLMTNAYHAMENEGGVLEVTLKEVELGVDDLTNPSMAAGTYVCLTVADTGIGMDQITMERIFEPYFTTKEIGKGTGLGMAVAHGIVKSYSGNIKVYSEPDKGTVFHVYLPVIKSQFETEKTEAVTPVPKGTERILLVDDEETIVHMEKQMLERLGYDVTERTSSIEALEAFRASPDNFDLVITDMTMPNMTGIQLAPKLLEIKPDIPIIICTGFSAKIDNEKAKAAGIRGYVMKPVVMSEIAKKIREVLDQD